VSAPPLALLVNLGADADPVSGLLRSRGVVVARDEKRADFRTIELEVPGSAVVITLMQYDDAGDFGCLFFTGLQGVDVAMDLAPGFHYVPVDVVHRLARGGATPKRRKTYLRLLGQAYLKAGTGGSLDPRIAGTLLAAAREEAPSLRIAAALAAMLVDPRYARELVALELANEADPEVRAALEQVASELGPGPTVTPPSAVEPEVPAEPSTAFVLEGSLASVMAIFASGLEIAAPTKSGELTIVTAKATKVWDARMIAVADEAERVGAVHFRGRDAAALALTASGAFHYLPGELVARAIHESASPAHRAAAQRATALLTSPPLAEPPGA